MMTIDPDSRPVKYKTIITNLGQDDLSFRPTAIWGSLGQVVLGLIREPISLLDQHQTQQAWQTNWFNLEKQSKLKHTMRRLAPVLSISNWSQPVNHHITKIVDTHQRCIARLSLWPKTQGTNQCYYKETIWGREPSLLISRQQIS